ncbi:MAG TPA: hypothetical protein VE343_05330, partial [Streptosporangiaceae bacterium]|nr:hypothetical protein [Streptosporangiaceae bacterium]
MALIAVAADKGAPGVTTSSVVLAAVWPRPVLLAECDASGGDLVYRLPAPGGGRLDPQLGMLSLAVASRHGLQPQQLWEHTQKLHGGLDVLAGVTGAEQGAGLEPLWGTVGDAFARLPQADVIADCGRLGVEGSHYDLLARAATVVLITRGSLGEVIRLRERIAVLNTALGRRDGFGTRISVVVVADHKHFHSVLGEVGQALNQGRVRADVVGGLAYEPRSAQQLRGEWGGKLDKSLLIRSARGIATQLAVPLPALGSQPPAPGAAPVPRQAAAARPPAEPDRRPAPGRRAAPAPSAPVQASAAGGPGMTGRPRMPAGSGTPAQPGLAGQRATPGQRDPGGLEAAVPDVPTGASPF